MSRLLLGQGGVSITEPSAMANADLAFLSLAFLPQTLLMLPGCSDIPGRFIGNCKPRGTDCMNWTILTTSMGMAMGVFSTRGGIQCLWVANVGCPQYRSQQDCRRPLDWGSWSPPVFLSGFFWKVVFPMRHSERLSCEATSHNSQTASA